MALRDLRGLSHHNGKMSAVFQGSVPMRVDRWRSRVHQRRKYQPVLLDLLPDTQDRYGLDWRYLIESSDLEAFASKSGIVLQDVAQ